jgi:hypothetical protein
MADMWIVYDYEVSMFRGTRPPFQLPREFQRVYSSALVESRVLHTRILCDLLLGTRFLHDISLDDLLPGFAPMALDRLRRDYGDGSPGTLRYIFVKKLAHPTNMRSKSYDYGKEIGMLEPTLETLFDEVYAERMRRGM